jgi:hypothetical protein
MVALMIFGLIAPLSAQNLQSTHTNPETSMKVDASSGVQDRFTEVTAPPGFYDVPAQQKAAGDFTDDQKVIAPQDSATLNEKSVAARKVDSVVDLNVLRNPSPYRRMLVSSDSKPIQPTGDSLQSGLAQISAVYRETGKQEKSSDCSPIALSVEKRVKLDPSKVLEIVQVEVGANPSCSCEIVKTAIKASEADVQQVVAIVETAIHASPESMRIISQCAIAAMPEAITAVQELLAKLDPNAGLTGYSSKSAKSGKDAKVAAITAPPIPNPLDRPNIEIIPPPPYFPPPVTSVDPCGRVIYHN